jgi:mitogen-activated protein kinase organizer 1
VHKGSFLLTLRFRAHDARVFSSCGGDRQAFLWDTSSGRIIRKFQGHYLKLNAIAFNSDASVLASGSDDKTVRLWDCRSSSRFPIQILEDAKDSISTIDVKDARIGVGSLDGNVRIYDIRKASVGLDYFGSAAVTSLSLGLDEQCHLVSTADSSVRLIDGPTGMELNVFTGHRQETSRTESVFSPDEAYVFSGSEDSNVYAWDIVSAEEILQFAGHSGPVTSLSHHPKEALLLSASTDGTIRLWS